MATYFTSFDDAVAAITGSDLPSETQTAIIDALDETGDNSISDLTGLLDLDNPADGLVDEIDEAILAAGPQDMYILPALDYTALSQQALEILQQSGVVSFQGSAPVLLGLTGDAGPVFVLGSGNDILNFAGLPPAQMGLLAAGDPGVTLNPGDGDDIITTGDGDDTIFDSAGADNISTGIGNDTIGFGSGVDVIDGGAGFDVGLLTGGTNFRFAYDAATNTLSITSGGNASQGINPVTTTLTGVEYIASAEAAAANFESGVVVMVGDDEDGNTAILYQVALGRRPDADGLNYWFDDNDTSGLDGFDQALKQAEDFVNSQEFQNATANMSDAEIIDMLYMNAFGRDADPNGLVFYWSELQAGNKTIAKIITDLMASEELQQSDLYNWLIQDNDNVV